MQAILHAYDRACMMCERDEEGGEGGGSGLTSKPAALELHGQTQSSAGPRGETLHGSESQNAGI